MRSPAVNRALIVAALLAPVPAVTAQAPLDVPGTELTVYLVTMGQGDQVWERFGHNAIRLVDRASNSDMVYNWGIFSFDEPGFLGRFLRGEMMYWMAGQDFETTLAQYRYFNRTVEIQELNLSPPQRIMLRDFIQWNARDENKYYRYDYFLDNCSTRVRDALDRVLGGALRQATDSQPTGTTYRWHALRLMAEDPLMSTGIDIGLGRPTDRPISAWEEMFIPMKVRDRVRDLRVPDELGRAVPLVLSERMVFQATRSAERSAPPGLLLPMLVLGVALGGVIVWLAGRGRRGSLGAARATMIVTIAVSAALGIVGVALLYLRLFTRHTAAYGNMNLFVYNPLWLAILVALAMRRPGASRVAASLAAVAAGMTLLGLVVPLVPGLAQGSYAVVLLMAPASLAAAWVIRARTQSAVPGGS